MAPEDIKFSATLQQDRDDTVTGSAQFDGMKCLSRLQVSGGRSYAAAEAFDLVAKDDDGHIRVMLRVSLVSAHTLIGTYNIPPDATGCDLDSGKVFASVR